MSYQQPADVPPSQGYPGTPPAPQPPGGYPPPQGFPTHPAPQHTGGYPPPAAAWGQVPPRPVAPGLGTASVVLAALVALGVVVQFLVSVPAVSTLQALVAGEQVSTGVLDAYDNLSTLVVVLEIAAAVVTIVWLWKSRTFAETVSPGWPHARSRVWVWLGWFVPVVAFWFPYQVVRDVRAATLRVQGQGPGGWWAAWLVFGFATNASARLLGSDSPDVWVALPVFDGVAAAAVVVAALLWAKIVREVSTGQRAATDGVSATLQAPAPGWS